MMDSSGAVPPESDPLDAALAKCFGSSSTSGSGAPPTGPAPQEKAFRIGDFQVLRELGRGGMGVVYEAVQVSLGRKVALKVLPFIGSSSPQLVERFRREAQAAARLHHPNIVAVYGLGEEDGTPHFAMQFIEGRSLRDAIKEVERVGGPGAPEAAGCLLARAAGGASAPAVGAQDPASTAAPVPASVSPDDVTAIVEPPTPTGPAVEGPAPPMPLRTSRKLTSLSAAAQGDGAAYYRAAAHAMGEAARALAYAHSEGVLHRDIKPENLLIDTKGVIWVADFGLAKAEGLDGLTHTGDILGTLPYMAPERFRGWSDPRGDIYSLGVTLYEVLVLQRPFEDTDRHRLIKRIAEEEPVRPRKLNPRVPEDLETIALKAMAKEPERRYVTAGEMADDLHRFLAGEPIHAQPPTATYILKLYLRRHRRILLAAGLVLAASLAAFWGWSRWQRDERFRADFASGETSWNDFLSSRRLIGGLEARWREEQGRLQRWMPVWRRGAEISAWRAFEDAKQGVDEVFQRCLVSFNKALDLTAAGSTSRRQVLEALDRVYKDRYKEALVKGSISVKPEYYLERIESLGLPGTLDDLQRGQVVLRTEPPGADVYCFRFVESEARLVPLPFDPIAGRDDPERGILEAPFLRVAQVYDPEIPFAAGDRILGVNGREVRLWGDLERALEGLHEDEPVEVRVSRGGSEDVRFPWVPFPAEKRRGAKGSPGSGEVIDILGQFGFTLEGYPLEFQPRSLAGATGPGEPLRLRLPAGSYLLVLRKEGYRDVRLPVAMPEESGLEETVRLLGEDEIPPGFAYIAAGPALFGGDAEAFQSLERGVERVPGFFMRSLEVSFAEYLEFLNDPEVASGMDAEDPNGSRPPLSDEVRKDLEGLARASKAVTLAPVYNLRRLVTRPSSEKWTAIPEVSLQGAVFGVSQHAAREYAAWLTRRASGRWRYRLPTDLEWEKAARGADRRTFVWGNYLVWSYCRSASGSLPVSMGLRQKPRGAYPADESVYGIWDLEGSVSEHTTDQPSAGDPYTSLRGGNRFSTDAFVFRIANRNGLLPYSPGPEIGIRLVADLEP